MKLDENPLRWLAILALIAPPALAAPPMQVGWKGKNHELTEMEAALAEVGLAEVGPAASSALDAIRTWSPWAEAHGYRMELTEDLRGLWIHEHAWEKKRRKDELEPPKVVLHTLELIDQSIAATDDVLRSDDPPVLEGTSVLFHLRNVEHSAALLDSVVARHEFLRGWAENAKKLSGYVLEKPLFAAVVLEFPDQEEWNLDNVTTNRIAMLRLARFGGDLPFWCEMGFAWHIEFTVLGTVYCFPYRDSFVYASSHAPQHWVLTLNKLSTWKKNPVDIAPLAAWQRSSLASDIPEWERRAIFAWGVVRYIAHEHPEVLPVFFRRLHDLVEEHGRIVREDGSWEKKVGYEPTVEMQKELLEELLGENVWNDMAAAFAELRKSPYVRLKKKP